jgi:type II secretory pathway component PulM
MTLMWRSLARALTLVSVVFVPTESASIQTRALTVQSVTSPARANSAQPQLSSSSRGLVLSWIERDQSKATLRFAERSGSGWSTPRDVASGTDWFVNWADVPSVIRLASGELVAHWLQKSGPDTYAYDVRLAYSKDDGKTWSTSFTPHSDGTKTEHGFASLLQMPGAGLGLAWLDGRAMKAGGSHDPHGADAGAMSVRFATFGRDWKQTSELPVDLRVCECCPTTAAITAEGPIVAYRNRTEDDVRDIFISRLENGTWTGPKAVHADGWKIVACPVNGPMLSARGRDVVVAWFTAQADQPRAFVAFSKDAGRTFGTAIRLDDAGSLGRVDVELMPDGSAMASWIELADQRSQLRVRRVEASGAKSPAVTVSGLASGRASGYPRIGLSGGQVVFAWTESENGRTHVRTASSQSASHTTRTP